MATSNPNSESEVRFNHGIVSEDGNLDLTTTRRALMVAEAYETSDQMAEKFGDLRSKLNNAAQYTEAHHAVTVDADERVLNAAHRRALGVLSDDSVAESVEENWQQI